MGNWVMARFDSRSKNWSTDPEINLIFIKARSNYANDCLRYRGHLFLNEVFDMLGLPRTSKGATDGWLLSYGSTVEFGPSEPDEDGAISLTFNIHGQIYDKIEAN